MTNVVKPTNLSFAHNISPYKAGLIKPAFWLVFALNYLYLNHLLQVLTADRFRLGVIVLILSLGVVVFNLNLRINLLLALAIVGFILVSLASAFLNQTGLLQAMAFIRIPVVLYLVYNLVAAYIDTAARAKFVLRVVYLIAIIQLPVVLLQRWAYDKVPTWFRNNTSLVDFGMGTFNGDTAMAFMLIGLVILLLFAWPQVSFLRYRWLLAGWLSITVLLSNSQIQQLTIVLVWGIYLVVHFGARAFLLTLVGGFFLAGYLLYNQIGAETGVAPRANALDKMAEVGVIFQDYMEYDLFINGHHARDQALHYYTHQPIRIIGEGPGTAYDTATGRHILGTWGHFFTYYSEVGLSGLLLSYLIFFLIAFPIKVVPGSFLVHANWVSALLFLSLVLVSIVKYPMGDANQLFSYCLILIAHRVLAFEAIS